jgi:hypothetical protein
MIYEYGERRWNHERQLSQLAWQPVHDWLAWIWCWIELCQLNQIKSELTYERNPAKAQDVVPW